MRRTVLRFAVVGSVALLTGLGQVAAQEGTPDADDLAPEQGTPISEDVAPAGAMALPPPPAGATVVATGLDNPRGMAFGPDGALYVAESGLGGDGPCIQGPEGNRECYGTTGAVTRIADGAQERVVTGLSSRAAEDGSQSSAGPNDVVVVDGTLYAVVGLGGNPDNRAEAGEAGAELGQLIRVADGTATAVVDIAGYEAQANPDGSIVDSNPYGMVALADGSFVVADAGANALLQVGADGTIAPLAVFPARPVAGPGGQEVPMEAVPDAVAVAPDGDYFVGQLTGFPFPPGGATVYRVAAAGGEPQVYAEGFTNIIDLAAGPDGSLYVLEFNRNGLLSIDPTNPATLEGRLVRVAPDGGQFEVAGAGLIAPMSVEVGADGSIFVTTFGVVPGAGQVLQFGQDATAGTPVAATPGAATPIASPEASPVA